MSFLSYMGKSLGAGSTPIQNAIKTSTMEQEADEWKRARPQRERMAGLTMSAAERAEVIAADTEAERKRGMEYIQGLRGADMPPPGLRGVTPQVSETPTRTMLEQVPTATPAVTAPAGLNIPAASTEEVTVPGMSRAAPGFDMGNVLAGSPQDQKRYQGSSEAAQLQNELNQIAAQIKRMEASTGNIISPELATLRNRRDDVARRMFAAQEKEKTSGGQPELMLGKTNFLEDAPQTVSRPAITPTAAVPTAQAPAQRDMSGYEIFRPAVDRVAPDLGFDSDKANTLMSTLGFGESRFNANAKSPSGTFTGAYQLSPTNVATYGPKVKQLYGYDPSTPEGQAAMALMFAADNEKTLVAKGIEPTAQNLALAHNQGAAGAVALLQNPTMPVGEALDRFAPDKASGAKRAAGQAWMKGADASKMTAGEFVERANAYYGAYSPEFSGTKDFRRINPDIYLADPDALTYDMQRAEFRYSQLAQRRDFMLNTVNAADPATARTQMEEVWALEDQMVQFDGVYAQLQVTKGLQSALGGDTTYLNSVLTGAMGYPIDVVPAAGTDGVVYQITAGGQPVSDYVSYDQMKQFVMRIVNSEYDAALTAAETNASTKAGEILLQADVDLRNKLAELTAQGQIDMATAEYQTMSQAILDQLNAQYKYTGELGLKPEFTELTVSAEGDPIVMDKAGRVFKYTLQSRKVGGKKEEYVVLERIADPRS